MTRLGFFAIILLTVFLVSELQPQSPVATILVRCWASARWRQLLTILADNTHIASKTKTGARNVLNASVITTPFVATSIAYL